MINPNIGGSPAKDKIINKETKLKLEKEKIEELMNLELLEIITWINAIE